MMIVINLVDFDDDEEPEDGGDDGGDDDDDDGDDDDDDDDDGDDDHDVQYCLQKPHHNVQCHSGLARSDIIATCST